MAEDNDSALSNKASTAPNVDSLTGSSASSSSDFWDTRGGDAVWAFSGAFVGFGEGMVPGASLVTAGAPRINNREYQYGHSVGQIGGGFLSIVLGAGTAAGGGAACTTVGGCVVTALAMRVAWARVANGAAQIAAGARGLQNARLAPTQMSGSSKPDHDFKPSDLDTTG